MGYNLTKLEVEMAGYWSSSFVCVNGPRWSCKERIRPNVPISSYLDQTSLVSKGFIK